MKQFFFI